MATAFISYARADEQPARRFADELQRRGLNIYRVDSLVAPGEPWAARLQEAIDKSDLFFTLVSHESEKSQWVASETALALSKAERGKPLVVPVLLERNVELPFFLRHIQALDFSDPERVQSQLDSLVKLAESSSRSAVEPTADLSARVEALRASREALVREMKLSASKRAAWSSTIAASIAALAAVLGLIAGLISVWRAPDSLFPAWALAFAAGFIAALASIIVAGWLRQRLTSRRATGREDH